MSQLKTSRKGPHTRLGRNVLVVAGAMCVLAAAAWGLHGALKDTRPTATLTFEMAKPQHVKQDVGSCRGYGNELIPTLSARLTGPAVLAELLQRDECGLTKTFPRHKDGTLTAEGQAKLEQLIERVSRDLKFRVDASSELVNVVTITFTHTDAAVAEWLPLALFNRLRDSGITDLQERMDLAVSCTKKELEIEVSKFKEAGEKKGQFEIEHIDLTLTIPDGGLQAQLDKLNADVGRVERAQTEEAKKLALLLHERKAAAESASPSDKADAEARGMIPNPKFETLKNELAKAKADLEKVRSLGMKPAHSTYQKLERTIEKIEKQIADEPEMIRSEAAGVKESFMRPAQPPAPVAAVAVETLDERIAECERTLQALAEEKAGLDEQIEKTNKQVEKFSIVHPAYKALCAEEAKSKESVEKLEKQLIVVEADFQAEIARRRTMYRVIHREMMPPIRKTQTPPSGTGA